MKKRSRGQRISPVLSDSDIQAMRLDHTAGAKQLFLSRKYGVSKSYVSLIVRRKRRVKA